MNIRKPERICGEAVCSFRFLCYRKLLCYANGREIPITAENIAKATEFAQINSELYTLYKFHNYLEVVTTQYTLDENGSERLMLKYYQYLLEAKNLLSHYYGIEVLHNLEKFPLHLDNTLQEYYKKISEKIEQHPVVRILQPYYVHTLRISHL